MVHSACTIKAIKLTTVINGSKYQGGIDKDGNELGEVQLVTEYMLPEMREYYCTNCLRKWDGRETFSEVKKHFGTFPID